MFFTLVESGFKQKERETNLLDSEKLRIAWTRSGVSPGSHLTQKEHLPGSVCPGAFHLSSGSLTPLGSPTAR